MRKKVTTHLSDLQVGCYFTKFINFRKLDKFKRKILYNKFSIQAMFLFSKMSQYLQKNLLNLRRDTQNAAMWQYFRLLSVDDS